jgi:hypothetical protein
VQLQRYVKSQICMGMGVPETFISPSGSGGQGQQALRLANEFMRLSLLPLQEALNDLMIEVHDLCFANHTKQSVECQFPAMQNAEAIVELYRSGIVNMNAVARTLAPVYNMEDGDFDYTQAPHSQKRRLGHHSNDTLEIERERDYKL